MIYLNNRPITPTLFPDHTSQVWKIPQEILDELAYVPASIDWTFSHEGELMQLAQLKEIVNLHTSRSHLYLTYLPYGRQDKTLSNDNTFALLPFAKFLNSLKFNSVLIQDPHSAIALAYISNSRATYPDDELRNVVELTNANLVAYPDAGAVDKYAEIYPYDYVHGQKIRDQATGYITKYELIGNVKDKNVLIVDDICDGGMTFKLLAKDLLAAGAKEVNMFVTHGIFSQGLKGLKEAGIKRIFTKVGEAGEIQNNITYRRL